MLLLESQFYTLVILTIKRICIYLERLFKLSPRQTDLHFLYKYCRSVKVNDVAFGSKQEQISILWVQLQIHSDIKTFFPLFSAKIDVKNDDL